MSNENALVMSTFNLGSDIGDGKPFAKPDLDRLLRLVLDWLEGTEYGLGEVVDRLQHLAACRTVINRVGEEYLPGLDVRTNEYRRLSPEIIGKIVDMRSRGVKYRDIARLLRISIGSAHWHANNRIASRAEAIREAATGYIERQALGSKFSLNAKVRK